MKVLAISLTLLLFQLWNISAHAIPRIEPSNASVIYEVQENNATTLRLINPKSEEPVLREIVYYHVIERAYGSSGNQDDKTISNEEPDFDDTRRPFTNGHGFPLPDETNETNIEEEKETNEEPNLVEEELIDVPEEQDLDRNDLVPEPDLMTDEVNDNDAVVDMVQHEPNMVYFYEIVDGEEVPVYYYYDDEMPEDQLIAEEAAVQATSDVIADSNGNENAKTVNETPKDNPEKDDAKMKVTKDIEILSEAGEEVTEAKDHVVPVEDVIKEVTEATDPVVAVDDVTIEVTEATDPVVAVDDVIIEVTEATDPVVAVDDVIIEKTKARNQLFENLKEKYEQKLKHNEKASSRRKRNVKIPEAPMLSELNYDIFPEYIRKIISTEKPPTKIVKSLDYKLEKFNDDEENLKEEMENKIEAILENLKPLEAEVYGSEEKATRTYGMNLTGDHGYVWNDLWTNPGISYDVGHIVDDKDNDHVDKPKPSDSNEDIFKVPDEKDSNEDVSHKDENLDIFVNIDKRKDKPDKESPKDDQNKPEVYVDIVENKEESKDIVDDKINANIENIEKEVDQIDKEEENKSNEIPEEKDDIEHKPDKDESKEPNENEKGIDKKPDTFDELIKNEEFWKWLAEWTSTYMELLTKHIKKIVKEEVDNHMKAYIESQKDDKTKKNKEEISLESKKEEVAEIKETIEEPVIKNDTIIIDGKEIPITHNTNFDQEELLKKRKDKENKLPSLPIHTVNDTKIPVPVNNTTVQENKAPIRITAKTIYGNSAGNEKVTNIFIFYNNKDSENSISDLKPKNNTVNNTFIFGQNDNATKEDKVIEIPKVDENIENNLEEIDKVSPTSNNDQNKEPSSKDQEDTKDSSKVSDKTKEPAAEKDLTLEESNDNKIIKEEKPNDKTIEQNKEDSQIENKNVNQEETIEPNKEENLSLIEDSKQQSNEQNNLENKEVNKKETKDENQEEHKAETKEEKIENKDETKEGSEKVVNVESKEDRKEPNKEENKEDIIDRTKEEKDETKEETKVENEDKAKETSKDENNADIEDSNADNKAENTAN